MWHCNPKVRSFQHLGNAQMTRNTAQLCRVTHKRLFIPTHVIFGNTQRRQISIAALDEARKGRERVVILGSGWAGYPLAKALDHSKFQVVIVSPRSYFVFTPLLAETSVGTLEFRTALEPIRTRKSKTQFIQGWADEVSFSKKTISIEEAVADPRQGLAPVERPQDGRSESQIKGDRAALTKKGQLFDLQYDKLVISVGCYSQTFNTPGVTEHSFFLKEPGDARQIRKRLLECFEIAALPTTPEKIAKQLLNFAIVGGGPTGIEFAAELHDIIHEDLSRLYPSLSKLSKITIYDVAPKVLSMFDENLAKYAADTFKREGINIATSRTIQELKMGLPGVEKEVQGLRPGLTLSVKGEEDVGVGMCVWSTGLMANPFIQKLAHGMHEFRTDDVVVALDSPVSAEKTKTTTITWNLATDPRTGSLLTDDRLRLLLLSPPSSTTTSSHLLTTTSSEPTAHTPSIFALGDCASIPGTNYPATAQVASQKATYLASHLNHHNAAADGKPFKWSNLGTMAYLGSWRGIVQGGGGWGNLEGRAAWVVWRGAYLVKSLSWRNRVLIPVYWLINWLFGRDISRF